MIISLADKLRSRKSGICLYGFAPPKQATPPDQLEAIVAQHVVRLRSLPVDGLIIYDIQDETERMSTERPFPFLPTLNPEVYAHQHLASVTVPGECQGSCRAHRDAAQILVAEGSGLSTTVATGVQFRMRRAQRSGVRRRARS